MAKIFWSIWVTSEATTTYYKHSIVLYWVDDGFGNLIPTYAPLQWMSEQDWAI
jgi:hypothetical protein